MVSIIDNKSSLKSNVIISLGEMFRSLGKQKKKDNNEDKNWKTSTQIEKENIVKNTYLNIESSKISNKN